MRLTSTALINKKRQSDAAIKQQAKAKAQAAASIQKRLKSN
jgi:hypothetical protein